MAMHFTIASEVVCSVILSVTAEETVSGSYPLPHPRFDCDDSSDDKSDGITIIIQATLGGRTVK